jgi:hypothetical protein
MDSTSSFRERRSTRTPVRFNPMLPPQQSQLVDNTEDPLGQQRLQEPETKEEAAAASTLEGSMKLQQATPKIIPNTQSKLVVKPPSPNMPSAEVPPAPERKKKRKLEHVVEKVGSSLSVSCRVLVGGVLSCLILSILSSHPVSFCFAVYCLAFALSIAIVEVLLFAFRDCEAFSIAHVY